MSRDPKITGREGIEPWVTRQFITTFDAWATKDWHALEWGSGDSTLWYAQRVHRLWTVEHNSNWADKVKARLDSHGITNTTLVDSSHHDPREYVDIPIPPTLRFDFVMVDGRNRIASIVKSLPKMWDGAILALDNADRPRYRLGRMLLNACSKQHIHTTNGQWRTDWWEIDAAKVAANEDLREMRKLVGSFSDG